MKTIQPIKEIISLFGFNFKSATLTQADGQKFVISLVGVFFITLILGLLLNLVQKTLTSSDATAKIKVNKEEAAAYQPGQFVSRQIRQGYLGH